MSLSRYSGNNDPFYNFFGNIHKEVEDMNNLFNDPFFQSSWLINQNQRQKQDSSKKDSKEVTKPFETTNDRTIFSPFGSFFNNNSLITPPVDIHENEKSYDLQISIPGAPKDKITIDFNKDTNELSVSGEIPEVVNEKKEGDKVVYSERSFGNFSRSLRLPDNINGEEIQASFENGVLHLSVPKVVATIKEKDNLHRIQITDGSSKSKEVKSKTDA